MPVTKVAFQIRDALRVRLQVRRFHASQQSSIHPSETDQHIANLPTGPANAPYLAEFVASS